MPMNGFTVGRDIALQIMGQNNSVVASFALQTSFDFKQGVVKIQSKGIDGVIRHLYLPDGWSGTMKFDRGNSNVDDYFAQLESNYYAGSNIGAAQITQTITEASGNLTQYRFIGVMMCLDDGGNYAGENLVAQTISWAASKRLKIQ
jgi:hypothetical protein